MGTTSMMLMSLTESFLRGTDRELKTADFINLSSHHDKTFGHLKQLLGETKLEHYVAGTNREYSLEEELVHLMQDITHGLGGLRSVLALQSELLAPAKYPEPSQPSKMGGQLYIPTLPENSRLTSESDVVPPADTQDLDNESSSSTSQTRQQSPSIQSPAEIFRQLTSRLEMSIVSAIIYSNPIQTSCSQMLGSYRLLLP
jgi:hypothetical protein